jgi:predicted 3-demethylubiquinone-9 3-methyltransferase (glyoxalase superfamily)
MQKITPFLWYSDQAEEAASLYASIFPDSRINRVVSLPSGLPGFVKIVDFVLCGQAFTAKSAGPMDDGGSPEQCGWLKDRYGLSWQIVPRQEQTSGRRNDENGQARH